MSLRNRQTFCSWVLINQPSPFFGGFLSTSGRSLFGMPPRWRNQLDEVGTLRWFATSPMLKVELTCLQALSDLDQMEAAWLEVMSAGDPKGAAQIMELLLSHMAMNGRRLTGAMTLDQLDTEKRATALKAVGHDCLQRPAKS